MARLFSFAVLLVLHVNMLLPFAGSLVLSEKNPTPRLESSSATQIQQTWYDVPAPEKNMEPLHYKESRKRTASAPPESVEREMITPSHTQKKTKSDIDFARELEQLPLQLSLVNGLESDDMTLNHKKSLLYQTLLQLPEEHRAALKILLLKEIKAETRGLGGKNTIILEMGDLPDSELIAVFIHELGHVVDTGWMQGKKEAQESNFLDGKEIVRQNDPSVSFYHFSWVSSTQRKAETTSFDFVSGYAMNDCFEDFAESYLAFVLHGKKFRSMMRSSEILAQKYEFLKDTVFQGQEFETGSDLANSTLRNYDATLLSFDLKEFLQPSPDLAQSDS